MMFITTNLAPSLNLFKKGAILVNKEGKRFVDERNGLELAIPRQPERIAYVLMDQKIAAEFSAWPNFISTAPGVAYAYFADYRRNRKDVFFEAETLTELAEKTCDAGRCAGKDSRGIQQQSPRRIGTD